MTFHKLERHCANVQAYRHNAEVGLKLASETKEIYAKMALIDLATEFRALAEDLERLRRVRSVGIWPSQPPSRLRIGS